MRIITHRAAVLLAFALLVGMFGCSSQGPAGPEYGCEDATRLTERTLPTDEGAWQIVDLIWCGQPGDPAYQEDPCGQLRYHVSQDLVFEGHVIMRSLLPDHEYLLTIVGHPDMPGSAEEYLQAGVIFYDYTAPEPYTGMPTQPGGSRGGEEYCDFALVITDQHGCFQKPFRTNLPGGDYEVTFVIKNARLWSHYVETGNFDTEVMCAQEVNFQITDQLEHWRQ
jgi:hypothetical protein